MGSDNKTKRIMIKKDTAIKVIMTKNLVTAHPANSLEQIKGIFDRMEFHHLPVVTDGNRLVGIISRMDIERFHDLIVGNQLHATAEDIMTKFPMSLDADDTVGLAADIFLANKFHAIPIVEDGELLGLVTTHDILRFCFKSAI